MIYIYPCIAAVFHRATTHDHPGFPGVQPGNLRRAAPVRYNRYAEFAKARVKKIAVQRLGWPGRMLQEGDPQNRLGEKWGFLMDF